MFVSPKTCNFIKKELAQMFSCEFSKISKNPFFTEHLWWLLLTIFTFILSKYSIHRKRFLTKLRNVRKCTNGSWSVYNAYTHPSRNKTRISSQQNNNSTTLSQSYNNFSQLLSMSYHHTKPLRIHLQHPDKL